MKKFSLIFILSLFFFLESNAQQNITIFYSGPDIPASYPDYDPACNGPGVPLQITLPPGGPYEVVQTQIAYGMEATSPAWRSDQRSKLVFVNNGNEETEVTGFFNQPGIQYYSRGNNIANGVYPGGTVLNFELHARRTWNNGSPNCGTQLQKIISFDYDISLQVQYIEQGQCLFGGITFTTQNELDNFPINYPGCTQIVGNVVIEEDVPGTIIYLDGLSNVEYMQNLVIRNNSALTNLMPLNNLSQIQQSLSIINNDALTHLNGLENLTQTQGVTIEENNSLVNFSALSNVNNNLLSVFIRNNSSLINLNGLQGQTSLFQIVLEGNSALQNLTGLDNLTQIQTGFNILNNGSSMNLTGLGSLTNINGNLSITGNSMTSLGGLGAASGLTVQGNVLINGNSGMTTFGANHHLRHINGTLTVSNNNLLQSLWGSAIETVTGDIFITNNINLNNFDGLQNLTTHNANITISNNFSLASFEGFENLTQLTGNLIIQDNQGLFTLLGLGGLSTIEGNISITNNNLSSLEGFGPATPLGATLNGNLIISNNSGMSDFGPAQTFRINQINGDVIISGNTGLIWPFGAYFVNVTGNLTIINNPNLGQFNGLESLSEIGGSLIIENNNALLNFNGMSGLTNIGGNILIKDNNNLINFTSINTSLNGSLNNVDIVNNAALTSLNGFSNITQMNGLRIQENHSLTNLGGLTALTTLTSYLDVYDNNGMLSLAGTALQSTGDLSIQYNDALLDFTGLNNLNSVDYIIVTANNSLIDFQGLSTGLTQVGSIQVIENNSLVNFAGMSGLTQINDGFIVQSNPSLTNFVGLNNLNAVNSFIMVSENAALTNFQGLNNLQIVSGFDVFGNAQLQNFAGLSALETVGTLFVENNGNLADFDGLQSLTGLVSLNVLSNNNLQSLNGLDNISATDLTSLSLQYNSTLSYCHIEPICEYLDDSGNYAEISFNISGCNTRTEVENECLDCDDNNPTVITFNGNIDNQWSVPSNWDLNRLPAFCDHVVIPASFSVVLSTVEPQIRHLNVQPTGSLTIDNTAKLNIWFSQDSGIDNQGTLIMDSGSELEISQTSGTSIINSGLMNIQGSINIGYSESAALQNNSGANFNLEEFGSLYTLGNGANGCENSGTLDISGYLFLFETTGTGIINHSSGVVNVATNAFPTVFSTTGHGIINHGEINNDGQITLVDIAGNQLVNQTGGEFNNNHIIDCANSFNLPGWFIENYGVINNNLGATILGPNCSPFTNVSNRGLLLRNDSVFHNYGTIVFTGQGIEGEPTGQFILYPTSTVIADSSDCD